MPWTKSHKSWHKSVELVEQLEKFHDKYARVPDMSPVKELETNLLRDLRDHMKTLPGWDIREFQYTGSVYENLKIGKPDEFDIMVIMRGKGIQDESCYQSGYRYLVPDSTTDSHTKSLDSKGHISPTKLQSNFFSTVVKSVNHLGLSDSIKPRMHGPAVQLDVTNRGHFFQIDVVPAIDVGGKLYVAKPHPGKPASWRVSTSLQEKAKLNGIDRDNVEQKPTAVLLYILSHSFIYYLWPADTDACLPSLSTFIPTTVYGDTDPTSAHAREKGL